MDRVVDNVYPWHHATRFEEVILWVAVIFFIAGVTAIGCIFISRIAKSFYTTRESQLIDRFSPILNAIIVNESVSENAAPESALQYRIDELIQIAGGSRFSRNVLIDHLISIKKNLTGRSATTLEQTYLKLGLHKRSLQKLNSFQWNVKARGIRELAEMGYRDSLPKIYSYLRSKNQILREESLLAIVRLDKDDPLRFLDTYSATVTSWMRIHLYHFLQKLDGRSLPQFSRWFQQDNTTVAIFSISMARKFRQLSAVPHLMPLLNSGNLTIVAQAIEALGDLDAYEKADQVAVYADAFPHDAQILTAIAKCLSKIGDNNQTAILRKLAEHADYSVRFESLKALANIDASAYRDLKHVATNNGNIINTIKHLEEPLLQ